MLKAVVLDFDGLILDTERATFEAWQAVYASYSQGFPLQLWLENVGTTNSFDPIHYLETLLYRPIDIDGLKQAYDRIYSEKIEVL
ncbi:MAG: HAD family phosphatase, partial [Anaerolineales bacterium]|nr:HAD family phosphatase [Anaerolineales bacterium]